MRTVEFQSLAASPKLIGMGAYGRVFHHGVDRVKKIAMVDGTLDYLLWAMARGRRYSIHSAQMVGIPKVHSVERVLLPVWGKGYEAIMDRYFPALKKLGAGDNHDAKGWRLMDDITEWFSPISKEFGVAWNDVHQGNVMFDRRRHQYVVTDPFAAECKSTPSPTQQFKQQALK